MKTWSQTTPRNLKMRMTMDPDGNRMTKAMTPKNPCAVVVLITILPLVPESESPVIDPLPLDVLLLLEDVLEVTALVNGFTVPVPPVADWRLRLKVPYLSCCVMLVDTLSDASAEPAL